MPYSHLACDGSTEPYPPFCVEAGGGCEILYGFTGSTASTILFSEKLYKFEKNL